MYSVRTTKRSLINKGNFYTTIKWQNQTYDDRLYRKSKEMIWVKLLKRRNLQMLILVRSRWYHEWLRFVVCFHMWEIIFHTKSLKVTAASNMAHRLCALRYSSKKRTFNACEKKKYQQEDWWWGKNIENKTSAKATNKCMAIKQSRKKNIIWQ